jgi:hypothetical protein
MRTRLRSKATLLFLAFAVAIFAVAGTAMALVSDPSANTAPSPTITSDKADYRPGELVTLTGGNWQPGESVNIKVNDTYGASWARNVDVTANANGEITDSFNLPNWFVSDYDVTATGAQSGTATTTFTDSNPNDVQVAAPISNAPGGVTAGNSVTYGNVSVKFNGGSNTDACTVTLGIARLPSPPANTDTAIPAGVSPVFGTGTFAGVKDDLETSTFAVSTTASGPNATPPGTYRFHVTATRDPLDNDCQGSGATFSTQQITLQVNSANQAPAATAPTFAPASPKTNDLLQASTTTSDAENNNVSVAWVWKVTRGANTCQIRCRRRAARHRPPFAPPPQAR